MNNIAFYNNSLRTVIVNILKIAIVVISCCGHYIAGFVGDENWLLQAAALLLEGKRLYVDVVEVNPPLIVWLLTVPVKIAQILGVLNYHVLVFFVLILVFVTIFFCQSIMAKNPHNSANQSQITYGFLAIFIVCTGVFPFADREHIFTILVFPYVLRWMPSVSSQLFSHKLRILVGCMAGMGFCIKPHCLIVFLAVQLAYIARNRSLRILFSTENIIIYTFGLGYLYLVYIVCPEYYLVVLPMAVATYNAFNSNQTLFFYLFPIIFTLAIALSEFRFSFSSPYRKDILYFFVLSLGAVLYALSNNGWGYTVYPLSAFVLFSVVLLYSEFAWLKDNIHIDQNKSKKFLYGMRSCQLALWGNILISLLLFLLLIPSVAKSLFPNAKEFESIEECSKLYSQSIKSTDSKVFGAIVMDFSFWPELARNDGAQLGTRFNNMWMLKKFNDAGAEFKKRNEWIIHYAATSLAQDLANNKPEVVFVEYDRKDKTSFLMDYLLAYAAFTEAWGNYSEAEESVAIRADALDSAGAASSDQCAFRVYKRVSR